MTAAKHPKFSRTGLWLLLAALLILGACKSASAPPARRLNLLLVTIDTLRADRLGCYGYSQIETPNLDQLARRGVLFENGVAPAPLTAPSHASMMTGLYPTVHKVRNTGGFTLSPANTTLASVLQGQGWDTAAFIGSSVLKRRYGLNQGFAVYDDEMPTSAGGSAQAEPERRAGEVVDRAVQWLQAQSGKPFFLWVHVYDPHIPYDPPSPFREKYRDRPYDGEIAYTDQQLGRLFDAVARKSRPEETLIAVLSDHGESFSEHGEYTHGIFLYDTTLRIAFLMAGGGLPAGVRVKQQARTIDLLPTVLELTGGKAPAGTQGTSLAPAFRGKEVPTVYSYSETLFPKLNMGWAETRAMRTNRWKYILAPKPELYDLEKDPAESANVIASHPAEVQELAAQLKAVSGTTEKVAPAAEDSRTMQQLKSLGYLGSSSPQELTGKGTDPKDRIEVLRLLHLAVHSGAPMPERIAMLRKAIVQDPDNPTLYNNLGNLYAEAGRPADAMKLYQDALQRGVHTAWLFSRVGSLYLRQGNKAEAIRHFEIAVRLNPSDYESMQNLAVAYRETGRIADCERVLNAILKSGEEFAPAYNELGMTAFQKGDVAAAQQYFEKAARLDATYQLNLGRFYKMAGDNPRARAAFEAFLAARSSSVEYQRMIPEVRKELAAVQ
ncbi:MAG TPA: sulfatase-like hydrolase/transferase [Verrucomicrobiae bacterium]|nr:sulfatase-like hydrolase/transferase [Verrucomicrobiae bacterium]